MTHPSKVKGNAFERELVNEAKAMGLHSERAYASNGKALGECEETDLVVENRRIQAKRRKKIAAFLKPTPGVDAIVFREDRGETFVLLRWKDYLEDIAGAPVVGN